MINIYIVSLNLSLNFPSSSTDGNKFKYRSSVLFFTHIFSAMTLPNARQHFYYWQKNIHDLFQMICSLFERISGIPFRCCELNAKNAHHRSTFVCDFSRFPKQSFSCFFQHPKKVKCVLSYTKNNAIEKIVVLWRITS